MNNLILPSPLEKSAFDFGCETYIKRDDLIHAEVSGNKYRKLKYIVDSFLQQDKKGIITFGGAFSNHIYATAAYCRQIGVDCIGIIRGEEDVDNPTLKFAQSKGMKLYFVPRSEYAFKETSAAIGQIIQTYSEYGILPEGGEHSLAMNGLKELVTEIAACNIVPDYIALSAGSGTTAAGIVRAVNDLQWPTKILILSPMKNPALKGKIIAKAERDLKADQVVFIEDYAGQGYAKTDKPLINFLHEFYEKTSIRLDPVYTGKLVHGLFQMSLKKYFRCNEKLIWIHSGGLQGIAGYNYLIRKSGRDEDYLIRY